jgi:serine protease DegS
MAAVGWLVMRRSRRRDSLTAMRSRLHIAAVMALSFAAGAAAALLVMLTLDLPSWPDVRPDAGLVPGVANVPITDPVTGSITEDAPPAATAQPASYADAVTRAAPAVVNIYGNYSAGASPPSAFQPQADAGATLGQRRALTSLGSGVLVSADGLLVTNGHIVDGADTIRAELPDGRVLDVTLLGIDSETDLAVLQAADGELPAVSLANPDRLRVGDVVLAIGNPFGLGQTVSLGIVSATGRTHLGIADIEHFIQTDAAINPGNSGGALIDTGGRLVGINTAILSESGISEGVGFAIPVDIVMGVVEDMAATGAVERGWIGIGARSLTPQLAARFALQTPHGVLVTSVGEGTPAALAGLRTGDVITNADGRALRSSHELREAVTEAGPERPVQLAFWRGSEQLQAVIITAERPPGGVAAEHAGGGSISDASHQRTAAEARD